MPHKFFAPNGAVLCSSARVWLNMFRFFGKTDLFGPKWSGFWAKQACRPLNVAVFWWNTRVWLNIFRFCGKISVFCPKWSGFSVNPARFIQNGAVLGPIQSDSCKMERFSCFDDRGPLTVDCKKAEIGFCDATIRLQTGRFDRPKLRFAKLEPEKAICKAQDALR